MDEAKAMTWHALLRASDITKKSVSFVSTFNMGEGVLALAGG